MAWRIVHVKEGDELRLRLDNLEVRKKEDKVYIPLSDISMVVLEGNRTKITTKLMSRLSQNNVGLVICDDKYLPVGMYLPYGQYHHCSKRVINQAGWTPEQKGILWKAVVGQKMNNQLGYIKYCGVDSNRIELIEDLIDGLEIGDSTNREGHVAKVYFDSLYGKSFTRDEDCLINGAMNFGYAIIRSSMARIVVGNGLITMLGIFHRNEFNSFNLADDLMEPYRPLMDYWVNEFALSDKDYLTYESRLKIIEFMNQKIVINNKKMTISNSMQEYVNSFVTAIEQTDPDLLVKITLNNFIGEKG
ncbi:type II CRISPR-associated endonuclease Cas1 [Companilactobacillus suantsaicola]|uniref:CRISPR-associated endonuclease Cas1 n=1 Tax=Companilactobacillus suantsaicola TaxID=2487723 RepID=A0A4Z0JLC6_9LACO|nr:type II CRISPR-associated endonuclease Cas1 [Companilactobacillus suantsaicola]TGD23761.1 type II CRISPR-associated endonuclease Cas1 [Companilactobacillus suantsaicola]